MDRIVVAAIAAIGIAAGQRLQQGVIQRGIGHGTLVVAGAFHLHAGQRIAPGLLRALAHLFKTEQFAALHAIGTQVAAGALRIHMRDGADHGHRTRALVFAQREAEPGAVGFEFAAHAVTRAGHTALFAPDAMRGERAIEFQPEPGGVFVAAAETLRGQFALDHAVADDLHLAADHHMAVVGLRHVDQHMAGVGARREGVALGRGACQRAGFGVDAAVIGEPHLVIAGLADFAIVRVARGIAFLVEGLGIVGVEVAAGADAAGHRQHRDLAALLPAAGAGQERMAEAANAGVVIAPAGVVRADRADLDQAEWRRGARIGIAVVLAADEGVDLRRVLRGQRAGHGHAKQAQTDRGAAPERRARSTRGGTVGRYD